MWHSTEQLGKSLLLPQVRNKGVNYVFNILAYLGATWRTGFCFPWFKATNTRICKLLKTQASITVEQTPKGTRGQKKIKNSAVLEPTATLIGKDWYAETERWPFCCFFFSKCPNFSKKKLCVCVRTCVCDHTKRQKKNRDKSKKLNKTSQTNPKKNANLWATWQRI